MGVRTLPVVLVLVAGAAAMAQQPVLISLPQAPAAAPRASDNLNQAAMSQVLSQLNSQRFEVQAAAAQSAAARPIFVPRTVILRKTR